jgi:hypothetical protein
VAQAIRIVIRRVIGPQALTSPQSQHAAHGKGRGDTIEGKYFSESFVISERASYNF